MSGYFSLRDENNKFTQDQDFINNKSRNYKITKKVH